jgi:hypothetical protein
MLMKQPAKIMLTLYTLPAFLINGVPENLYVLIRQKTQNSFLPWMMRSECVFYLRRFQIPDRVIESVVMSTVHANTGDLIGIEQQMKATFCPRYRHFSPMPCFPSTF